MSSVFANDSSIKKLISQFSKLKSLMTPIGQNTAGDLDLFFALTDDDISTNIVPTPPCV